MLISVEIQKFRNLEMLKFINVEVYISKTLDVFLNVLSIFQSCTHRGRTSKTLSSMPWVDMLSQMQWELPAVQEYKNDLLQPDFLGLPSVQPSSSHTLAAQSPQPDPLGPCTTKQWANVQKMVA